MSPDEHIPSHEELIDRLDEALNNYTRSLRTKIDRLEKQLELERQMSKKQDPLKDIPLTGKIDFAAEQRAAENLTMKDAAKKSVQGGPITKAGAGKMRMYRFPGHRHSVGEELAHEVSWQNNVDLSVRNLSALLFVA